MNHMVNCVPDRVLRDISGNKIGTIKLENGKQMLRNKMGELKGSYDPASNVTLNALGSRIGSGNLLVELI